MTTLSLETVQALLNLVTLVAVLVLALAALGTAGLAGLFLTLRQNGRLLEHLYQSASPETQKLIRDIVLAVQQGADLAEELTDGDPDTPQRDAPG